MRSEPEKKRQLRITSASLDFMDEFARRVKKEALRLAELDLIGRGETLSIHADTLHRVIHQACQTVLAHCLPENQK